MNPHPGQVGYFYARTSINRLWDANVANVYSRHTTLPEFILLKGRILQVERLKREREREREKEKKRKIDRERENEMKEIDRERKIDKERVK